MVLGQVQPEREVLDHRQEAVGDVLPGRHATRQRVAQEAAAEHEVAAPVDDRLDQRRDPRGVVLVVGVEHHDDVGAGLQRRVVARLLVAAVAPVLGMDDHVEAELAGDVDGLVLDTSSTRMIRSIEVVRDVGVGALERRAALYAGMTMTSSGGRGGPRREG